MAWRCSGSTNAALISNLANNGLIKSDRVKQAMLSVDRAHYAPSAPYEDTPVPIGYGATISAPHMHASAAESLLPFLHAGAQVLDIGAGSGYLTHVLANLVGAEGRVTGVDHIRGLVDLAKRNVGKGAEGMEMLKKGQINFVEGDGRKGWVQGAPYDAIHVGAAAVETHASLLEQLKAPGRMFIPVGDSNAQYIWIVDKNEDGTIKKTKSYGVRYVPLTDAPETFRPQY